MTNIISGDDFHTALKAGTLNPRAQEIADAITGAQDNMDRIGGLYEYAYRGALAGIGTETITHSVPGLSAEVYTIVETEGKFYPKFRGGKFVTQTGEEIVADSFEAAREMINDFLAQMQF